MDFPPGAPNSCPALTGASATLFLSLVNSLMVPQCVFNLGPSLPTDYSRKLKDGDEFDYIIIGAGSAGSVLANRLSEDPNRKVLLIEAGSYPSVSTEVPGLLFNLQRTSEDWAFSTEPSNNYCKGFKDGRCRIPAGKVIGGTSTINAMLYLKGYPRDYDEWGSSGNVGWSWDLIRTYFDKSLQKLTKTLPVVTNEAHKLLLDAAAQAGLPVSTDEIPIGYRDSFLTIRDGKRCSAAKAYLTDVRPNLYLALNTLAVKLIMVQSTITGVRIKIDNNFLVVKAKKEFIVSSGAINTPKLLQLSGIGPPTVLTRVGIPLQVNLPVGKNYQDHIGFFGLVVKLQSKNPFIFTIRDFYNYFTACKGPFATIDCSNVLGFISTKSQPFANLEIHHIYCQKNDIYVLPVVLEKLSFNDATKASILQANKNSELMFYIITVLGSKSRGSVELKSNDFNDSPLIYPNFFQDPDDMAILLNGINFVQNLINTQVMKDRGAQILEYDTNCIKGPQFWQCMVQNFGTSLFHPSGTCKMGVFGSPESVVNARLKVYGVQNLRIVDASIMPTLIRGNPNAAVMAIAEKVADYVKADNP